jgi:hypothetical protein
VRDRHDSRCAVEGRDEGDSIAASATAQQIAIPGARVRDELDSECHVSDTPAASGMVFIAACVANSTDR